MWQAEVSPKSWHWPAACALAIAIAVVGYPVLRHPTEVLYSPHSDILAQHLPFRHLLARSLRERGRLPLWNPTAFGGMPLVGDPQSGIFYPPNWLHALVPLEYCGAWFGPLVLLHLAFGGAGMLWWLGGHGLSPSARLTGALAFVFAGKWFYHLAVPGHVVFLPLVYLPWQCGLVERLWHRPNLRRAGVLGSLLALTIAGSHPQILFFAALVLAAYCLAFGIATGAWRPRSMGYLVLAVALALAASAVHWIPILEAQPFWVRGTGMAYEASARHSIKLSNLSGFLVPVMSGPGKWEGTLYTGVAAMALACLAWSARHCRTIVWFGYGLSGFCVWYAFGENGGLHRFLFDHVPGFHLLRIPTRSLLLLGLPIGCLAAAGVDVLCRQPRAVAVTATTCVLALAGTVLAWQSTGAETVGAVLALAVPAVCWLAAPRSNPQWTAALAAALVFCEQAWFAAPLLETRPLAVALGRNPLVDRLTGPLGRGRMLPINYEGHHMANSLPIAYCTINGIESVRGFNPLVPAATFRWLHQGVGRLPLEPDGGRTGIPNFPLASTVHLELLNVRWVVSNQPLDLAGWQTTGQFDNLRVYHFVMKEGGRRPLPRTWLYENPKVFPRAAVIRKAVRVTDVDDAIERLRHVDPRDAVVTESADWTDAFPGGFREAVVEHSGDEIWISVDAGQGGYLTIGEFWYPGWRAWDNGAQVELRRVNGVFCGTKLGSGTHRVRLLYRPTSYQLALALSLIGLGFLLAAILWPGNRRRDDV